MNTRMLGAWMLVAAAASPSSWAGDAAIPTGSYLGGGRACNGKLIISGHRLSWRTSFSRCSSQPFKFSMLNGQPDGRASYLFELQGSQRHCPYRAVVLIQKQPASGDPTWEAIGYPTLADQQAERLDDALACPLVRLDAK